MVFMDRVCFKEVKFEDRGRFVINFGRMNIKGVGIFPAVFSNSGFISFLILGLCLFRQTHSLCFDRPM